MNHYGDARQTETPNFRMMLMVSQWPWAARVPWDDRPWIVPQLAAPATFADWRDRRDPALALALDAVAHGTLPGRMLEAVHSGGVEAAVAAARTWSAAHPNPWGRTLEPDLDALAGRLIDAGATRDAVAAGQAWTRLYPESGAAWRRLGEACLEAGDREQAVASLRRALALSPRSRSVRAMLERLGEKP